MKSRNLINEKRLFKDSLNSISIYLGRELEILEINRMKGVKIDIEVFDNENSLLLFRYWFLMLAVVISIMFSYWYN